MQAATLESSGATLPGPARPRRRLLFLAHRCPYPPEKGEKIRAWHLLDHLCDRWEVDLGFLLDDPADLAHLPFLRSRCASVEVQAVGRRTQMARALLHLRPGQPLTRGWFHAPGLAGWVRQGLAARRWDAAFVYSSAMAPYVMGPLAQRAGLRRVLDMVDIDSEKWLAYAADARAPMRQVWAREGRTLLRLERDAAREFDHSIFVSEAEASRFAALAPDCAARIGWVDNGVDLARFDPARAYPNPYAGTAPAPQAQPAAAPQAQPAPAIVFTGTMGYRPNIDAVCWFATAVLPLLRGRVPAPEFHIVGANPAPAVLALAALEGVHVSGSVPDVRPWIAHAAVAVAPLRIARGIQNKVLEAMALGRPVVASPQAFEGIHATPGRDLLVADGAPALAAAVAAVLDGAHPGLGAAGRAAVAAGHDWQAALRRLDPLLALPA
ncbi:MAG: putative glycosyltransferase [Belnapia sp.]|nr:putative glycosyltransferase [Belnapia sp.]